MYEDKTNFGHSTRRKTGEHEEPEDDYLHKGGEQQCPDLPLWDKFILLDGDEDFMDERMSSKRMRGMINQYGDESDGDYDGGNQGRMPRVSLNCDGDSDSDSEGGAVGV